MSPWIFIFLPVVISLILLAFWIKKLVWWEILLLIFPSMLLILILNFAMVTYNTSDKEYLGTYVTDVNYYEPWDEEVPCRHPIYCTRSCGKNCRTTYVCGHLHAYDVDYHPERFTKVLATGEEISIGRESYYRIKGMFNHPKVFVDMDRDYHSIDGDCYRSFWEGEPQRCEPYVWTQSYENKIQASHSVFRFEKIDSTEIKKFGLYSYPEVIGCKQKILLGAKADKQTKKQLDFLNAYYGQKKQIKIFILTFNNKPLKAAIKQRSYWEGGNKNEFVICVGKASNGTVSWVKSFSWMKKPELSTEVNNFFKIGQKPDYKKLAFWLPSQIEQHWHRRNFSDFDYLSVELTETQLIWIFILVLLYNIFMSYWVVNNDITNSLVEETEYNNEPNFMDKFFDKLNSFNQIIPKLVLKFTQIFRKNG